ncbi:unnamed protein product [Amoebophrya sp. A25]|nr:unnamed protein product [Amoebophrya sp. A25]|eukprot:GSA25T00004689001.1
MLMNRNPRRGTSRMVSSLLVQQHCDGYNFQGRAGRTPSSASSLGTTRGRATHFYLSEDTNPNEPSTTSSRRPTSASSTALGLSSSERGRRPSSFTSSTPASFAEAGSTADDSGPDPGDGGGGSEPTEDQERQVINNFPVLPFVIPIPVGGAASMSRSGNTARQVIPSAHDLGQQAKWNGFWKTVQDVAAMKMAGVSGNDSGGGGPPSLAPRKRPSEFERGMIGAEFVYESPINALGQPDITAPIRPPAGGMVVDSGNPFL